ncbi:hypothetical protein Rhopal_006615-T1 [Rhodotorula paludigena]|uniref:Ferritin-like domain-containing protein n=1 Tax=Rhodotorula paludigena TaxID=86838 RepID=A0AAV5GTL9_9BASI|nr:hypothetical protein Rhopal_006615-T1 [Rhodotorula paludigena]
MRTAFLSLAALASFAASAFAAPQGMDKVLKRNNDGKASSGKPSDVEILNYALTLEFLERNFYADVLKKFDANAFKQAGYSATVRERFVALAEQEASHVNFLVNALGEAAVTDCTYVFGLSSPKAVVATARLLENTGVAAYLGAAGDISDPAYLAAAASILTIEARHASYLNEINGATGFPAAYDSGLNYAQVYSIAAPLIVPNTCGAGALPKSIQVFPTLTWLTKKPRAGSKSAIKFTPKSGYSGDYYVAFIWGGKTQYAKVGEQQTVNVPKDLVGLIYAVVTTSSSALDNSNTVAGPGVFYLD